MKRGTITGLIVLTFIVIILIAYSGGGLPDEFPAPDFTINDIFTGNGIELSAFKGRPVILYFFASW